MSTVAARRWPPESLAVSVLLTGLVAFGPMSTDMYLASLPALTQALHTDVAAAQATLSAFLVGFALSHLAYGPLSDRFGRRPVLLAGVALYVGASVACALAQTIDGLIAARFVQALGAGSGPVLARAVVRDVHGRERAATVLAYMGTAMGIAPIVAPILGGYLTAAFGWRANFVALTGFGAALLAAVWTGLEETNRRRDAHAIRPGRIAANYLGLLRRVDYLSYVGVATCIYGGLFAFISGSSFVLIDWLGVSAEHFGYAFATVVLGYVTGTFLAGRFSRRLGSDRMIRIGTAVCALAGAALVALALLGAAAVWAIVGPMFVYMVGTGVVLPNAAAGAVGPFPEKAGAASALLGFLQMTVSSGVGLAVGFLHDGTPMPMVWAILACAAAGLALFFWAHRAPARRMGAET
jgi:DHA1 family bicyclomycin/chloramphenicol resistance-like MFS transporter